MSRPWWLLKNLCSGGVEILCSFRRKILRITRVMLTVRFAVSSVPGKLLHRWRRALVMPGLLDIAAETQCGGLAGRATVVASHLVKQTVEHHITDRHQSGPV